MIIQKLVVFVFLFILVDANPIDQSTRNHADRQRHHLGVPNQQLADIFHKRLSEFDDHRIEESNRVKRSEGSLMLRPVGGPMNIEQLPAMLAARYVKRYPYSQQDDPEIIG